MQGKYRWAERWYREDSGGAGGCSQREQVAIGKSLKMLPRKRLDSERDWTRKEKSHNPTCEESPAGERGCKTRAVIADNIYIRKEIVQGQHGMVYQRIR